MTWYQQLRFWSMMLASLTLSALLVQVAAVNPAAGWRSVISPGLAFNCLLTALAVVSAATPKVTLNVGAYGLALLGNTLIMAGVSSLQLKNSWFFLILLAGLAVVGLAYNLLRTGQRQSVRA